MYKKKEYFTSFFCFSSSLVVLVALNNVYFTCKRYKMSITDLSANKYE